MGILPTLLRRLKSGWKQIPIEHESDQDYQIPSTPLPDFVTQSLFSDLLLPEVMVTTPPQTRDSKSDVNSMPIFLALKTLAPGRATRRFGVQHIHATHWIAPPNLIEPEQKLTIEAYCDKFEEIGNFQLDQSGIDIRCVRPLELKPTQIPREISVTSNAYLEWRSQIIPYDSGTKLELPQSSAWCQFIEEIYCFTHSQHSPVEVRRFAIASHAHLRIQQDNQFRELDTTIHFQAQDEPIAVGSTQFVDAVVFRYRIPANFKINSDDQNSEKIQAFRTAYFQHCVLTDTRLNEIANSFQRDWLYQIYLSMLTARALVAKISLAEAFDALIGEDIAQEMARVLEHIFQTLEVEEESALVLPERQRVHNTLLELCQLKTVQTVLNDLAKVLWEEPEWDEWAKLRFKATLGSALLDACGQMSPQFDSVELILDIDPGPRPPDMTIPEGVEEIWITESTIGGGGVVEEILRRYAADPANFFGLARSALDPSDFEVVDTELTRLLELIETKVEVAQAMATVRAPSGYSELKQASDRLRKLLAAHGILVTHSVMTAINARILRPGSNQQTDKLLLNLIRLWHQEENRLGIEISARVFAYIASQNDQLDQAMSHLRQGGNPYWRFQVIYGLLWSRGNIVRSHSVPYNPFTALPHPDRELLLDVLQIADKTVWLDDPSWREQVKDAFKSDVSVLLMTRTTREDLKAAILSLVVEPIDIGFLQVYPHVEGIQRHASGFAVRLRVQEVIQ